MKLPSRIDRGALEALCRYRHNMPCADAYTSEGFPNCTNTRHLHQFSAEHENSSVLINGPTERRAVIFGDLCIEKFYSLLPLHNRYIRIANTPSVRGARLNRGAVAYREFRVASGALGSSPCARL